MHERSSSDADQTAVRTPLWRALHVQIDPPPHVLEDEVGLRLAAPDDDWRRRPDMDPEGTRPFRASIVATLERSANRARASGTPFVSFFEPEDLMALAREAGFRIVHLMSAAALGERYFAQRTDGLHPPSNSEEILVATI